MNLRKTLPVPFALPVLSTCFFPQRFYGLGSDFEEASQKRENGLFVGSRLTQKGKTVLLCTQILAYSDGNLRVSSLFSILILAVELL